MSPFETFYMAIAHPNIAFLLLSLGALGIYFELANPGAMLPGIAGVTCLILGFLSLGALPLSFAGLALVVLGLALLGAEIFVTSGGVLGTGGLVAFALGGLLLVDEQQTPVLEVSRPLIAALTLALGGYLLIAMRGVIRVRARPAAIGGNDLQGREATVRSPNEVFVAGELWRARPADDGDRPLKTGDRVRVRGRRGLDLLVEPVERSAVGADAMPRDQS